LSLQAVVYRLNSLLKSFTNWYILLLSYYPCSFSTCFIFSLKVFLLFLSTASLLCFYYFFISFLRPSCLIPMYQFATSLDLFLMDSSSNRPFLTIPSSLPVTSSAVFITTCCSTDQTRLFFSVHLLNSIS